MVYKSCSIDSVIGKIIRDTRIQDSAYIIDMHEWIPEVLSELRYEAPLSQEFDDVQIHFHKGKMPCGLIYIDAIEWQGWRLQHSNSVKNIRTSKHTEPSTTEVWTSGVTKTPTPDGNGIYFGTLTKVRNAPCSTKHYYQTELDYILTSFEKGCIRIYYKKAPHDERGLPLIPENQSLKECIYWYCRSKMIGAGFEDKVFKEEVCWERYQLYLGKASAEIDFPSPDMMEEKVNTFARFIAPEDYYNNYFRTASPEPFYDPLGARGTYTI